MLKTWLRRWLDLPVSPPEPSSGLVREVSELHERVDYLTLEVRRLRGRVTGGLRVPTGEADGGGEASDETLRTASPVRGNPQAIALLEKRRGHVPR